MDQFPEPGSTPNDLSQVLAGIRKDVEEIKTSIPPMTNTETKPLSLGFFALVAVAVYFIFLRQGVQ